MKGPKPPTGFSSDGCSGIPDWIFYPCCRRHDIRYDLGGDESDRRDADWELARCMVTTARKTPFHHRWFWWYPRAPVWYLTVRLIGHRYFHYRSKPHDRRNPR